MHLKISQHSQLLQQKKPAAPKGDTPKPAEDKKVDDAKKAVENASTDPSP